MTTPARPDVLRHRALLVLPLHTALFAGFQGLVFLGLSFAGVAEAGLSDPDDIARARDAASGLRELGSARSFTGCHATSVA